MSKKTKVNLRVSPEEAVIVWDIENWRHLIFTYETLAEWGTEEDRPFWLDAAQHIRQGLESRIAIPVWGEDE